MGRARAFRAEHSCFALVWKSDAVRGILASFTVVLAAACTPQAPAPRLNDPTLALRNCEAQALQRLPRISSNIMVAPGIYSNNGLACRPATGGLACSPRADWLPPTGGDPNASAAARAVLVEACMRNGGLLPPIW